MADIFVFGSNLLGIHKKGAALNALQHHGAILGQGIGLQGNSYAIPTKLTPYKSLDLIQINKHVAEFIIFAQSSEYNFILTAIGCGLAGYKPHHIAPMFSLALGLSNIKFPAIFLDFLSL